MATRPEIKQDAQDAIRTLDWFMANLNGMNKYFGENLPKSEEREKLKTALFDATRMVKISQTTLKKASKVK